MKKLNMTNNPLELARQSKTGADLLRTHVVRFGMMAMDELWGRPDGRESVRGFRRGCLSRAEAYPNRISPLYGPGMK